MHAQKSPVKASVLAVGILFIILSACVIFGNTLVIVSILKFQRLKTLTNRLVLSLAVADFTAGILIFYQSCFSWFPQLESSPVACLFRFLNAQPSLCSAMHLVSIAVDRYIAVLHPLRYNEFVTPKVVNILVSVAWATSIVCTSLVIGTAHYIPGSLCTLPDIVPQPVLIAVIHVVITSLVVAMCFFYGRIFWVARKQMKQIHAMVPSSGGQDYKGSRMARELKAARQLSTVVLVFFTCHATFLIVLGLGYFEKGVIMPLLTYITWYKISMIVVFCNSSLNPVVYALKIKDFRQAFKRILCPCGCLPNESTKHIA